MINYLQKQLLNGLHSSEASTPRQAILFNLLICLNKGKGDDYIKSYSELSPEDLTNKENYFKVLVELHCFCLGEQKKKEMEIIRTILDALLRLEKFSIHFQNIIPKSLFIVMNNYDPRTYDD